MRIKSLTLLALLAAIGCNSAQLRFTTLRLTATLPDLQEKQVLDNLARLAASPGALPYFAVVDAGTANVDDNGGGSLGFTGAPKVFTTGNYGLSASRTVTGNWSLQPLNNPDRLAAMRAAYMLVLRPDAVDPRDMVKLQAAVGADPRYMIPGGWLRVGSKHDVPREARLVAQDAGTFVWVMPQDLKSFSDFVLVILNIASVTTDRSGASPLRAQEGPPPGEIPGFAPRLYEGSPGFNRGLFFVPRR